MKIISSDAEIERAGKIRCQPEFLAELPGMFVRKIFGDNPVLATQLRIAEISVRLITMGEPGVLLKNSGRCVEPIVIFRGPQEVVVETGLRRERQRGVTL